jgi:hypothetical protein
MGVNPWKLTAIAMALVVATAVVTGLVVANITGKNQVEPTAEASRPGAAIGVVVVGAGGGTLYGLNENRKHDARYREAYGRCLRARGYTG